MRPSASILADALAAGALSAGASVIDAGLVTTPLLYHAIIVGRFDGGVMKKIAKYAIHVVTDQGEYGPSEDVHMVLDHLISTFLALIPE